jgi:hypothetical protein
LRIDNAELDKMFAIAGITRTDLHDALRSMGRKMLSKKTMEWSEEYPTRNYCYVVSEMIFAYLAPEGSVAYKLRVLGDEAWHRFVKYPDGQIVDLTVDQFVDYSLIDYNNAKTQGFMYPSPSKRARHLAELLKLGKPIRGHLIKD